MKRILLPVQLLLIALLATANLQAKGLYTSKFSTYNSDTVPKKELGDLSLPPQMNTTLNAGTKSITIEAKYKNGTTLVAKKINNELTEVNINGNKVDATELPSYAQEVVRLEDLHAMFILANSKIYKLDPQTNEYKKMYIDRSFMSKAGGPAIGKPASNTISPELTSKLIEEVKNDDTQNPYKAYIVNPQTNDVEVKEFSRNEYLKFLYVSRKRVD